jgi:hypothetical protein
LYETLTEICYFGNGGYTFDLVYDMPIWLRRVTYGHLINFKQTEVQARSGTTDKDGKLDSMSSDKIKQILKERAESITDNPDYVTKARK